MLQKPIQIFSIILLTLVYSINAHSQQVRINTYGHYVFSDKFESFSSASQYIDGRINGGFQWGAGLQYLLYPLHAIDISYYRQEAEVPVRYYRQGDVSRILDVGINYIMLGTTHYLYPGKVQTFGGLMFGTAIYNNKFPVRQEPKSLTKFAWGIRFGAESWLTDRVGLRLQAQLLSAVQGFGGEFYIGSAGSGTGLEAYSTLYQFSLGGAIVILLDRA